MIECHIRVKLNQFQKLENYLNEINKLTNFNFDIYFLKEVNDVNLKLIKNVSQVRITVVLHIIFLVIFLLLGLLFS